MAIKINNKDITTVHCPGGAEAQAVRIYNGTSWSDVWTNVKIMTLLSNGITGGFSNLSADKRSISFCMSQDGSYGSLEGGGTVVVYLDGEWTNPKITFDWQGYFVYVASGSQIQIGSGSISLYHRAKGSTTAKTTTAVSSVKAFEPVTYSGSLTGTFDRIGLSISVSGYKGTFYMAFIEMTVKNFNIGIQKAGFPDTLKYDYD